MSDDLIRRAVPDDGPALLDFVLDALGEDALQPVSEARVADAVRRCVTLDGAIAGIVGATGEIRASVGVALDRAWSSEEPHLTVRWLATAPKYRRENCGARMLRMLRWAQQEISAAAGQPIPVLMSVLTSRDLGPKMHMMSCSAPQVGATYALGVTLAGAITQRGPGHDPYGEQLRERRRANA